jgi:hypothetical protein
VLNPPGAPWLQGFSRFPLLVDIPPLRDAHVPVDNAECDGSYQPLTEPTMAAFATIEAIRFCTGFTPPARGLTATPGYTP